MFRRVRSGVSEMDRDLPESDKPGKKEISRPVNNTTKYEIVLYFSVFFKAPLHY